MKKTILLSILALLGITQAMAQDYEYVPFVREGVKWVCYYENNGQFPLFDQYYRVGINYFTLEINGDTIIDGNQYKALHKYCGDRIDETNDTIPIYLREEGRIVYGIAPEGRTYPDILIGYGDEIGTVPSIYQIVHSGKEFILYNFDNPKCYYDSIFWRHLEHHDYEYLSVDEVSLGDNYARSHHLRLHGSDCYLIEGIGYDTQETHIAGYPLFYMASERSNPPTYALSHVIKDGKIIYKGMRFNPDAIVLPGDVDGDGEITISDANSVIDIVVMGGNAGHTHSPAADANGDGEVTIADVNTIVTMIMDN